MKRRSTGISNCIKWKIEGMSSEGMLRYTKGILKVFSWSIESYIKGRFMAFKMIC